MLSGRNVGQQVGGVGQHVGRNVGATGGATGPTFFGCQSNLLSTFGMTDKEVNVCVLIQLADNYYY